MKASIGDKAQNYIIVVLAILITILTIAIMNILYDTKFLTAPSDFNQNNFDILKKVNSEVTETNRQLSIIKDTIFSQKLLALCIPQVEVTAYSPSIDETDDTPFTTAFQTNVAQGICAISRDIEKVMLLNRGDYIWIEGYGIFMFDDRMGFKSKRTGKKITRSVDIFMWTKKEALKVGRTKANIYIFRKELWSKIK